jgi:hypothetical protein
MSREKEETMQTHPVRRVVVLAGLALLSGAMAIALTQCQMTSDKVTGVGIGTGPLAANSCIKACNDTSKVHYDREQQLHDQNVASCKTLPQPQKGTCLAAEDARHMAEMDRLSQEKIDCQNHCHQQGTGGGL